jgi:RNA methyltransferase, TrmH family
LPAWWRWLAKTSSRDVITSAENEVVHRLRRAAQRKEPGVVLLEGDRVIGEAVAAGLTLDLLAVREGDHLNVSATEHAVLSRGLFRQLSQVETPQGALALARAAWRSFDEALESARRAGWPLVALDRVQDPGNAGAIVRTAAGAGAPAVVALPGTADLLSPKAIRGSAGNVFRTTIARATWEDIVSLTVAGAATAGGSPPGAVDWRAVDVLVLGSEAHGLSGVPSQTVTVPLAGGVESLNVAAAAAVLLFRIRDALG